MTEKEKHPVNFADCYVLTNQRSQTFIHAFLERFVPRRQEYTYVYEIPQFADNPDILFQADEQLIAYLEQHPNEVHAIYWSNQEEALLRGAMCLFTSDGQIIAGLYCETRYPDTRIETGFLKELMTFCNSTTGLILYEEPAPRDTAAFLKRIQEQKPL